MKERWVFKSFLCKRLETNKVTCTKEKALRGNKIRECLLIKCHWEEMSKCELKIPTVGEEGQQ